MIKKRVLSFLLSIALVLGSIPLVSFDLSDEGYPILNETETVLAQKVMNLELSVRTVKTHDRNIRVIVNMNDELRELVSEAQKAGCHIYYKYCRSVRKSSRYITWRTMPDTTYVNKEGVTGKRYYYKVRVLLLGRDEKVCSSFVNLAESELKQCRYGVRIWTKE